MEWIWCEKCVNVDDCTYATNSDGCYWGETEEEYYEEDMMWNRREDNE